ncbi:FAD-dependent oxidoreductase [Peteryoungia desertarenae]|uniref:FAD-dependent oxidoreductase n=1 Tax=Peteryoungia desertarenae TaxID=1813451 RepID=A0ABX6QK49_9HYPH|nr:FAD-dependent oxidoreductase [Peteryoungia desertarenae]QLF68929.1 FAD-dependent oxidoreductase [Peteryoungia desertarenae]
MSAATEKHLLLVGAGHAHLFVLERLANLPHMRPKVTVISPDVFQYYSGMLPGWLAGHYATGDIRLNVQALAEAAGAQFIADRVVAIDADRKMVRLSSGAEITADVLSFDIGSETEKDSLKACGDLLLPVKPLERFQEEWHAAVERAVQAGRLRLVVVGGGAAGVELAMAAQHALKDKVAELSVSLVTGKNGYLKGHVAGVHRRVRNNLERLSIEVLPHRAEGSARGVMLDDGREITADVVIAATGARSPELTWTSGLSLDDAGFIKVGPTHQSVSHVDIFAAGDISGRSDPRIQKSGVHAVRAGPVLAHNLLVALGVIDQPLKAYEPRNHVLYLLACGEKYAVASWGWFHVEGRWVWTWKDWIDRRFITRFSRSLVCNKAQTMADERA